MKWYQVVIPLLLLCVIAAPRLLKLIRAKRQKLQMSPEERAVYEHEQEEGVLNTNIICPYCKTKGSVRTKPVVRERRSVTATVSLIRRRTQTTTYISATQLQCEICNMRWDVK